jgi:hypothetical protein
MGHLDPLRIASNSEQARATLSVGGFTERQAEIVARAAERVVQGFGGDAASIWSTDRSGDCSFPAPLMLHGFFTMMSSSTAVFRIVRRSRYTLASVTGAGRPDFCAVVNQRRTIDAVMSARCTDPNAGTRWHRIIPS